MSETADAVVIGAGVVGASVAYHLAKVGVARVIVVEKRFLAAGATGKSSGLVRMHYDNEPESLLRWKLTVRRFRLGQLSPSPWSVSSKG